MNIKDFVKPTIITAQQYGTKVTVELDHSDTSLDELFDAFQTICIGLGYHQSTWDSQIKDMADELREEELEKDEHPHFNWEGYTDEDEMRMDIIGQNGNDGLHYNEEELDWPKPNNILIDAKKQYDEQIKKTTKKKKAVKKSKK